MVRISNGQELKRTGRKNEIEKERECERCRIWRKKKNGIDYHSKINRIKCGIFQVKLKNSFNFISDIFCKFWLFKFSDCAIIFCFLCLMYTHTCVHISLCVCVSVISFFLFLSFGFYFGCRVKRSQIKLDATICFGPINDYEPSFHFFFVCFVLFTFSINNIRIAFSLRLKTKSFFLHLKHYQLNWQTIK